MSAHHQENSPIGSPFENMGPLSDEAVWELLEMLCGLIDAYEEYYAEPLQRLRLKRYQELHESEDSEHQLSLSIPETLDEPF